MLAGVGKGTKLGFSIWWMWKHPRMNWIGMVRLRSLADGSGFLLRRRRNEDGSLLVLEKKEME
jgi:hypothetical protein